VSRTSKAVDNELVQLSALSLDAFCIATFDGSLKFANPAFAHLLGYTQEELLARRFTDNVHADDRESVDAVLAELANGKDLAFECRQICADGSVRRFEWNTHAKAEEGVLYGVARDVTDRRGADAELSALRRVATLVAGGAQPQDLFAVVAEEVSRVVDVSAVSVVRYETDGTATECANFNRGEKLFPIGVRWSIEGTNILRLVRDSAESARIDDYSGLEGEMAAIVRDAGVRSTVGVPIVAAGRLWGTIVGSTTEPEPLPDDTASRLADFTELLATAIENAESREALERLADEQAALRRIATLVAHGVRPDEIFAAVSDEVERLIGTDSATVMKFDDEGPGIVFVGVASNMSAAFPLGARWEFEDGMASAEVYRTGRSARGGARDWSTVEGPVGETHHRLGIVSTVATPIVVEGHLWGAITVQSQKPLPPDTDERLEKFTELVGTAIANAESRAGLARLAKEQAALRRVATLVARGAPPAELFAAVTEEAGQLLLVDSANMSRHDPDGMFTTVAAWSTADVVFPVGRRWVPEGRNVTTLVFETGRPARMDSFADASGPVGVAAREAGFQSVVGTPIVVEGRLWGAMTVSSTGEQPLPGDTEARLASFTELVATAIANAESRAELTASRARIVTASDEARRRIEHNLHDGAQQRLVSIALELRLAESTLPPELDEPREALDHISSEVHEVLGDLREISRGIHPAILSQGGLGPAMRTLARRSAIPVELHTVVDKRLPEPIEVAAYFVASEALTNATKHSQASRIEVSLATNTSNLLLSIRDDGVGGADPARGSGLVGLSDRVEAIGGTLDIKSAPGGGTSLVATLPLDGEPLADRRSGSLRERGLVL
jgi:PAS domain S-box-containing protein